MPKYLYIRGGIYWMQKTHKGQRHRISLETPIKAEAQRRLAAKLAELTATDWGEKPRRSFDAAAEKFVDEHLPTLKPSSAARYMVSLGWLADAFQGMMLDQITSGPLYEFEHRRYNAKASKPTIRRDLACLSALLGCAMEWEWLTVNPVPAYKKSRAKKGLRESAPKTRYLFHPEESGLLGASDTDLAEMISFAIDTGLRKEEQFSLMRHHISIDRAEVLVTKEIAKNGKERRVPLLPRALEIARRRMMQARTPYLFPTKEGRTRYSPRSNYILKRLKAAAKRAGIAPLIWHDLRRTCGCRLLQDYGADILKVRDWLGHGSVTVTERSYAFLAIDGLHGAVEQKAPAVVKRLRD